MGIPAPERCGVLEQRLRTPLQQRKAEEAGLVQLGEENAQGRPHSSIISMRQTNLVHKQRVIGQGKMTLN